MSARQRAEARERAYSKGANAAREGKPVTANPYKPPGGFNHLGQRAGEWSLHPAWECGYRSVKSANTQ